MEGNGWREKLGEKGPRGAPGSPLSSLAAWKGDGKKTGKEKLLSGPLEWGKLDLSKRLVKFQGRRVCHLLG